MDFADFLRAARRRWIVVAATVAVAMGVGLLSTRVIASGPPVTNYQASSVILNTGPSEFSGLPGAYNIRTIAALATVGEVPKRVAERLGFEGDPLLLASQIRSVGSEETGLLRISATSTDPARAKRVADYFAEELVSFLNERNSITISREAQQVQKDITTMEEEIRTLDSQVVGATGSDVEILSAERDAKLQELNLAYQRLSSIANTSGTGVSLQILQDAVPIPLHDQGFLQVRSWPSRMVLAAILGLLAAGGIVYLLERLDTRIRNRDRAERAFELPVLTEVPKMTRRQARVAGIIVAAKPKSAAADAYRILAAGVTRRPPKVPQVIMVTSAGPGEGKTTTTANLAATYAEVGRKVLIISCDLHRPQIHRWLGVPNTSGLSDLLSQQDTRESLLLDGHVWKTSIDNVRVIPSGPAPPNPAELLASERMRRLIREAREAADVVLFDTAPILAVSDATSLFPETDAVLISAWAGKTTDEAGRRTNHLLEQLGAQAVGVALIAVADAALPRGYYQYYAPAEESRRSRGAVAAVHGPRGSSS